MRWGCVAALCLLAAAHAAARDDAGRLTTIIAPNNTQPAVRHPGETFTAVLRANVPLRIESASGAYDLETISAQSWRGQWQVEAKLPDGAPPGAYTLIAAAPGAEDRIHRAVYVTDGNLETYTIAHVANLRVGDLRGSDAALFRVTASINARRPDLVIVNGDLTATGAADQFRIALDVLNDLAAPTFVAPGAPDGRDGFIETYLGLVPVSLPFGPDAYLLCPPPGAFTPANQIKLHIERRAHGGARWSAGLAAQFPHTDERAALTLFVDDPLDYLFDQAASKDLKTRTPWGRTTLYTAATARAEVRWFTVTPRGIEPLLDLAN